MREIAWPSGLTFGDPDWFLEGESSSSGRGLDGRQQIVTTENRRWVADLGVVKVWKEAIPAMRAFVDGMNGRANYTLLPVCNLYRPKKITDPAEFARHLGFSEAEILQGFTNYSDGTHFTDGTGFALPVYTDAAVTIEAAAGASFISTAGYAGSAIVAGVYFSVDGRLYRVESNEGGVLRINPPLRATIAAGTTLEIEAPTVRVRFSDDTVGRFAARHDRFGEGVRISVVEAFL